MKRGSFFLSLIFHVLFLALITFFASHNFKKSRADFVTVDLVDFSAAVYKEKKEKTAKIEEKAPVKTASKVALVKKNNIKKKEKPVKKAIKKNANKKNIKVKNEAISPKKIVKTSSSGKIDTTEVDPEKLAEAIKSVKKTASEKFENEQKQKKAIKDKKKILDILTNYHAEIAYRIRKNWAFPTQFAKNKDLETVLVIKILKNGSIDSAWFEKRSGNKYLDDSAYKAVMKANPLPPLPKELGLSYHAVGFSFTPLGIH